MSVEKFENCNDVPTEDQEPSLGADNLNATISDLDAKVILIPRMEQGHARQPRRCSQSQVISALQKLPNELIFLIFGHMDEAGLNCASKLCHRWREVAMGWPGFWTELVIPALYPRCNSPSPRILQGHVQHYVAHAHGQPISLTIEEPDNHEDRSNLLYFVAAVRKLHDLNPCWSSISLENRVARQIKKLLRYFEEFPDQADNVTEFTFTADELEYDTFLYLSGFEGVTELDLRCLGSLCKFTYEGSEYGLRGFQAHWGGLTFLSIGEEGRTEDYLDSLCFCRALEVLFINPNDFGGHFIGWSPKLLHLRNLSITSEREPAIFFECLRAPALQELSICFGLSTIDQPDKGLEHFLNRHRHLRILQCTGKVFMSSRMDLDFIPHLEILRLIRPFRSPNDENVFQRLTYHPSVDQLSQLQEIVVEDHSLLSNNAVEACFEMLVSRCGLGLDGLGEYPTRLRKVVFIDYFWGNIESTRSLDVFRERGILSFDPLD